MRKLFKPDAKPRCDVCGIHLSLCVCRDLPVHALKARIAILQHPEELKKSSNTVRLAHRICPDLELLPWPERTRPMADVQDLLFLYPAVDATELSPEEASGGRIVVLDGTWAQCSRLSNVLRGWGAQFRSLPVAEKSAWGARRSADPQRTSSAQAVARVLEVAGEFQAASALDLAVVEVGRAFLKMRGKPTDGGDPFFLQGNSPHSGI